MNAIKITAAITSDHALHVALPENTPSGAVELIQLFPETHRGTPRKAGSARGRIKLANDFDQPLGDFKDYMP